METKKRYKLIKEYPDSPELGTVVRLSNLLYLAEDTSKTLWFSKTFAVENNPEFWEEIVEPKFYVSAVKGKIKWVNDGLIRKYDKEGKCIGANYDGLISAMLPFNANETLKAWDIHSVTRVSDGEVFTVGDKVAIDDSYAFNTVTGFNITENITKYFFVNPYGEDDFFILSDLTVKEKEMPKRILVTEDGVEVFDENKTIYVVYSDNVSGYTAIRAFLFTTIRSDVKAFSTAEKAREYLDRKNKRYSLEDIERVMESWNLHKGMVKSLIKTFN